MSLSSRILRVVAVFATASLSLGIGAGAAHALTVGDRITIPIDQPDLPQLPPIIEVDPCVIAPQLCTPPTVPDPDPTTTTTVPTTDTTMPTTDTTVKTTPTGDPAPLAPAPHTVVTGSPHFTG
jgi:hypothetical protein